MRNLKLQFCNRIESKIQNANFLLTDSHGERSDGDGKLFVVTSDKLYATNEKLENVKEIASFEKIVGASYLAMTDEVCLAIEDGRILCVVPDTGVVAENSFCDVGLLCMAWSPEQEVVVFVTKTHKVVTMTCTYDPISEHSLEDECEQEQQFVNVGWGRKETQFHGSEGKNAAKQKSDFEKPQDVEDILTGIEISWRYDGAYFVISFVSSQYGRMFKVFDKEGVLQYTSEKVSGLQPAIAWRPSGTWIAIPHVFPNKSTVALFEKNGLRHREIVLPFDLKIEKIVSLQWCSDSDVLAIHTELLTETGEKEDQLYLYTIGNYHWYLKQVLRFGAGNQISVIKFGIDSAFEKTLHVFLSSGEYLKYRWSFGVDKFDRDGIVGVIDGRKLLLTNFSKAIVPPPMSSAVIEIDEAINSCCFFGDSKSDDLYLSLYDCQGRIHLYKTPFSDPATFTTEGIFKEIENQKTKSPSHLSHVTQSWSDEIIATTCENHTTTLMVFDLDRNKKTFAVNRKLRIAGIVNTIYYDSNRRKIFVHTLDNFIWTINLESNELILGKQRFCSKHRASQIISYSTPNFEGHDGIIVLADNQSLYVDTQHIADYVTSICLEGAYLAFTKHSDLHLLRLSTCSVDDVRSIESGGKLITICESTSRAVLQMPRGNLETFYPRLLLLDRIGEMLDCQEYEKVMELLVKQRINLNIICDHDINAFVKSIQTFVDDISNLHWLNLFLSDLRNEDITKTMYAHNYKSSPRTYPPDFIITEKIKYICQKMLNYMEECENSKRFLLPIVTAKVKVGKMEEALELIWKLKKEEKENGEQRSEEVLKYLLYLVDVNDLYNVALGTYDFGLVLFVAQKSQKDPREFLPFLNELKELEIDYRKFKVDEHLKRFEKALENISKCGQVDRFEEALEFVIKHQLYSQALKCYKAMPDYYKRICLAYADSLRAAGKLDNASLLYERGGDIAQALRCAKHILDWRRVIALAQNEDPNSVADVALSIVPALVEKRMNEDAYLLSKMYGNDFVEALECLLKGNCHLKAIYETLLQTKETQNLLESLILPSLLSYALLLESNLNENLNTFEDYKNRLLGIRERKEKEKDLNNGSGWGGDEAFDESDLLSDTTSMRSSHYTGSSRGTGKTFRSSKNRRKHERKHFSLKPGNPFEDIALIDALYSHIIKITEQQEHIRDTCKALIELNQDDIASRLQNRFKHLLTIIQDQLHVIWIPELVIGIQQLPSEAHLDFKLYQNEQRYALLDPLKRYKPTIKIVDWEHAMLT